MLASCWWSSGQDMGFCSLGVANSKSGYCNFFSSCQVLEFLRRSYCFVSQDTDPCIETSHLVEPPVWCKSLLMVSNLHSEQLSAGLCRAHRSLLLAGPPPHYPQCHNGLAPSRSEHMCLCRSVPRGGSWCDKWEDFPYLRPQSPASKTLIPSRIQHRAVQGPCAYNSPVPG